MIDGYFQDKITCYDHCLAVTNRFFSLLMLLKITGWVLKIKCAISPWSRLSYSPDHRWIFYLWISSPCQNKVIKCSARSYIFFVLWFVGQLYQNYILCTVTSHIYPSQPWQLVRVVVRVVMVRSPKIPTASKGRCSLKREKSHLCGIHLLLSLHWPLAATTWANKYTSSCQVHAHAQAFIFKMHIVIVLVKVNLMLIVHLYQLHIFKNWATNICWNQTKILIKFNLTR